VLQRERGSLMARLGVCTLSSDQIRGIREFGATVSTKLKFGDEDFQARRSAVEAMSAGVTLTVEDGRKVAYFR
jgi:hypothetical protein